MFFPSEDKFPLRASSNGPLKIWPQFLNGYERYSRLTTGNSRNSATHMAERWNYQFKVTLELHYWINHGGGSRPNWWRNKTTIWLGRGARPNCQFYSTINLEEANDVNSQNSSLAVQMYYLLYDAWTGLNLGRLLVRMVLHHLI